MAWYHQATSHYLSHHWPRSMLPYALIRPLWVKLCNTGTQFHLSFLFRENTHICQKAKYPHPMKLPFVTTWYNGCHFCITMSQPRTFIYMMVQKHYFCTGGISIQSKNIMMHIHVGLTEWTENNFMHPSKLKLMKPFFKSVAFLCLSFSVVQKYEFQPHHSCHRIPLMRNQHQFRWWLGATRQQAITWANVDPDLYRHMASQGHYELNSVTLGPNFIYLSHSGKTLTFARKQNTPIQWNCRL